MEKEAPRSEQLPDLNCALPTRIVSVLRGNVTPLLLLGAGAAVKSGVPLAGEMVERVARWGYCNEHGLHQGDLSVMRTDWFRWLTKRPWYKADLVPEDNYPAVIEKILQPKTERKRFFLENILGNQVQPSRGYEVVCNLIARRLVTTILTTNFDEVLQRQAAKHPNVPRLEVIQTPVDFTNLSTSPAWPQLIYLHGSVEHYTDQNTIEETEELNRDLIGRLVPLLRDHPVIVIGYRGAESSVVRRLLSENAKRCDAFRHGIFWCIRGEITEHNVHKNVLALARQLGSNFHFVSIAGFDVLLEDIWSHVESTRLALDDFNARHSTPASVLSFDRGGVPGSGPESLDQGLLRTTLLRFCEASGIAVPESLSPEWFLECARTANVLQVETNECTVAGALLFGNRPEPSLPAAKVVVKFAGSSDWLRRIVQAFEGSTEGSAKSFDVVVSGNLWNQLDRLTEILGVVNRPFRLKGAIAEDVYPYAPIALREFLTNLIVHRDYLGEATASISISPETIRFENPGGLVARLQTDTRGASLQDVLQRGVRGLKGYRNPAISEFFLVTKRMEKEGSGLPDVLQEAAKHSNEVSFGPSSDNTVFVAEVRIRPDVYDPITETARPARSGSSVLGNMLEVLTWPKIAWKTGTTVSQAMLFKGIQGARIPTCFVAGNWLWSFEPTKNIEALHSFVVEEEAYEVPTEDLLADRTLARGISQMLSDAVLNHVGRMGLIARRDRDGTVRAYYPRGNEGPRSVTYRGRFREATRMVAKPFVSRATGLVSFWEHKALAIKPERAGQAWFFCLLPTYVFTLDGLERPIDRDRIGGLTTRRAARDYNPSVRHDLAFWLWVLSQGAEQAFPIRLTAGATDDVFLTVASELPLISAVALEDVPEDEEGYRDESDNIREIELEIEAIAQADQDNAPSDPDQ